MRYGFTGRSLSTTAGVSHFRADRRPSEALTYSVPWSWHQACFDFFALVLLEALVSWHFSFSFSQEHFPGSIGSWGGCRLRVVASSFDRRCNMVVDARQRKRIVPDDRGPIGRLQLDLFFPAIDCLEQLAKNLIDERGCGRNGTIGIEHAVFGIGGAVAGPMVTPDCKSIRTTTFEAFAISRPPFIARGDKIIVPPLVHEAG